MVGGTKNILACGGLTHKSDKHISHCPMLVKVQPLSENRIRRIKLTEASHLKIHLIGAPMKQSDNLIGSNIE